MDKFYVDPIASGGKFRLLEQSDLPTPDPDLQFKIVIVGDSGCGKTSLLSSYIRGSFPTEYEPTIFENHRAFLQDSTKQHILTVDLWDTAGQEDYERLRRLSYQDSNLIILAYSLAAKDSLLNIPEVWAPEILGFCDKTPIVLVGLKSDVAKKQVTPAEAYNVAKSIGAVAHIECSAKQMYNVDQLFNSCVNVVYNKHQAASRETARDSKRFSKGHFRGASAVHAAPSMSSKDSRDDSCCTIV
ncbi:hypothetical protein OGAPHI_005542 [Ogataea philodendri]|uniref:Uncharacterized protein n=1 Tax=Ogataea philodendri TaxID=1378263 RepID=A0A9P8NZX3_9ASCO|nr:uncharacterized protein OGAPHI_005542 [Ogataea philodendri]KAH3662292.1 hypothetical protein OGAPHI_005542 [Ogataea philodendri]